MSQQPSSWEGTILAFVVILSILIGIGYTIAINFGLPIPWLAIVLVAVAIVYGARHRRRRSP